MKCNLFLGVKSGWKKMVRNANNMQTRRVTAKTGLAKM